MTKLSRMLQPSDSQEPPFPYEPTYPEQDTVPLTPMVYVSDEPGWEYKIVTKPADREHEPSERELNELGAAGWELAGVVGQADQVRFFFKRPRN